MDGAFLLTLSLYTYIATVVGAFFPGQFLRSGVEVDESRRILFLPDMEPVPVMRKPVWHFMERDDPDEQLCWVSMNPGYQGKRLIQGHYLDYLVGSVLSSGFVFVEK